MAIFSASTSFLVTITVVLLFAGNVHAFGAGNIGSISKVEGYAIVIIPTLLPLANFLLALTGDMVISKILSCEDPDLCSV